MRIESSKIARAPVPKVLLVESDEGWWDGRSGWVQTWGEAVQFDDGADCLAAAEEARRRTGMDCRVAFVQRPLGSSAGVAGAAASAA